MAKGFFSPNCLILKDLLAVHLGGPVFDLKERGWYREIMENVKTSMPKLSMFSMDYVGRFLRPFGTPLDASPGGT